MRTQIRIVAGSLRGRKLTCEVSPSLRPTPQMVREALFSILGNAVPDRPFYDVFAGTGVIGIEALSRGASSATFVERDFRLLDDLDRHLREFELDNGRVIRADVYRWIDRWQPPAEPINVYLSPPFVDLDRKADEMLGLIGTLQERLHPGSVLVLQAEKSALLERLADREERWDERRYGRNHLLFYVKEQPATADGAQGEPPQQQ